MPTHVRNNSMDTELIEMLDNTTIEMIEMFDNAMVVIIFQCINVSNELVIQLKLMQCYMSVILHKKCREFFIIH